MNELSFRSVSLLWLESIKDKVKKKTYETYNLLLNIANQEIGDVLMSKITFNFIGDYFKNLNKKSHKIGYVISKDEIRLTLLKYGYTRKYLRRDLKITSSTLSYVYNRSKISIKWANDFSKKLNIPFDELFNEFSKQENYSELTIRGTKTVVRLVLDFAKRFNFLNDDINRFKLRTNYTKKKNSNNISKQDLENILKVSLLEGNNKVKAAIVLFYLLKFDSKKVSALDWNDINFTTRKIIVTKEQNYAKELNQIKRTSFDIPKPVVEILKDYRRENFNSQQVFTKEDGERVPPRTINFWVKNIAIQEFME